MTESSLRVFWDDRCLDHRPPDGSFSLAASDALAVAEPHPDRPERIENVRSIVERTLGDRTTFEAVTPATREQLERVHHPDYLDELRAAGASGGTRLTPTTAVMEDTYESAIYAAGAALSAVETACRSGIEEIPYSLARPSGHHAQPAQADGFCFLNNVAVATEHAIETGLAERVAVIDWDVHHGNGTQECFYERDDVLVVSLHGDHGSWDPRTHPQTGGLAEVGSGDGEGYNLNVPLPPGTGDKGYERAFDRLVEPVTTAFDPELVLVSAGQDPGVIDPLGRHLVTKKGFEELGRRVRVLAENAADGRLGLVQEGGYQLTHLAIATLGVLEGALATSASFDDMESDFADDPFALLDENVALAADRIGEAETVYGRYWDLG